VNERFAFQHWRAESPLGKRVRLYRGKDPSAWLTVVGVAPNMVQNRDLQEPDPLVYVPYAQQPSGAMWVMMQAQVPFSELVAGFRRELQAIDPDLPIVDGPAPMAERFARAYQYRAVMATLFLVFAVIALLMSSLGLYAVIAHSVSERTQEIGLRTALGAGTGEILALVLRQGTRSVAVGLVMGLAVWFAVNSVLRASLLNVSPTDPATLTIVCAVLIVSATIGCLLPVRRALRVDPAIALRPE
jgi:putative ABC transport system permease protein